LDVICDIETDGLNATQIWVIVCKEIEKGTVNVFHPFEEASLAAFRQYAQGIDLWIGHNFISFDGPTISRLLGIPIDPIRICDTLVLSRLIDADRPTGHSLESWGEHFGHRKQHADIEDWSQYTKELEERCLSDVEINFLLYNHFRKYLLSPTWQDAIATEHFIAHHCDTLSQNGFAFDYPKSILLKDTIDTELLRIDKVLKDIFLPKVSLVKHVIPRGTKHGTINKQSIPRVLGPDFSPYTIDAPFSLIEYVSFNPASAPQRVERLNEAGWKPYEKTKGHKEAERELNQLRRKRRKGTEDHEAIKSLEERLKKYLVYGWTVSEGNLATLPPDAPEGSRKLARRLLLASRSSTLQQWINASRPVSEPLGGVPEKDYTPEWRIHGSFNHIGAWTHRMSHDRPNMGNVPKYNEKRPETTPYSDEMRSLWKAGKGRLLVGVDAESIQLRILAHYIDDAEFTASLVSGNKEDGTDPHSVNRNALGPPCKSRDDAKTFIYAWLLGAGLGQVAHILVCSKEEAKEADTNFLDRYPGLRYIKDKVAPVDAERGYFQGFDGRYVRIFGEDTNQKKHLALAGYLQNGEAVIMKRAVQIWYPKLIKEKVPFWWVNFVHDEWQTETINDMDVAKYIAETQADAIRQVGVDLKLRCPMAGSILNAHGRLAIGDNWMVTH
jgi:DNA polymerase I - 3''-5'' exonuclease and polymerase domains